MIALSVAVFSGGCGTRDQIARYTVTKPELVNPTPVSSSGPAAAATKQQVLGAIIPTKSTSWFFKLTGDPEAVEPVREQFLSFVKSISFTGDADPKPSWTLPAGWQELSGSEFRFATLRIPQASDAAKPLEITVSSAGGDVLANVNRWRGQVGLAPITAEELAKTTETFKVGEYEATFVSLVGTGSGGMGGAPMAPFASGGATPRVNQSGGAKQASSSISFEAPPEWKGGALNQFRKAAFTVTDGQKQAEITVIDLEPGSGDLLANVNRWRDQVGLSPITAAELASSVKKIDVLGVQGDYVELIGPSGVAQSKTILGVMAFAGGRAWFIKLLGDSELAAREKSRFEAFAKSIKLK
jgi:hypothetical protein